MTPRRNKKVKSFGKKTENKYHIRSFLRGSKSMCRYHDVSDFLSKDFQQEHEHILMFTNVKLFNKRYTLVEYEKEKELNSAVIYSTKHKSKPQVYKLNPLERRKVKHGCYLLMNDVFSDEGITLTKKYTHRDFSWLY